MTFKYEDSAVICAALQHFQNSEDVSYMDGAFGFDISVDYNIEEMIETILGKGVGQ